MCVTQQNHAFCRRCRHLKCHSYCILTKSSCVIPFGFSIPIKLPVTTLIAAVFFMEGIVLLRSRENQKVIQIYNALVSTHTRIQAGVFSTSNFLSTRSIPICICLRAEPKGQARTAGYFISNTLQSKRFQVDFISRIFTP